MTYSMIVRDPATGQMGVAPHPERRQVGMVDAAGRFAVCTGDACVAEAGHLLGDTCASPATIGCSRRVWEAMVETFEASSGWLPRRLLLALRAAEDAGGDQRGQRSSAVSVVRSQRSGRPWQDQVVDLRVDDDPDAVAALSPLVEHTDVYHRTVEAFEPAVDGQGAAAGRAVDARDLGAGLLAASPEFVEVARRFVPAGLVDADLLAVVLPDERPDAPPSSATVRPSDGA